MQLLSYLPPKLSEPRSLSGGLIALTVVALVLRVLLVTLKPQLKFFWHAFLVPIGKKSQQKDQLDTVSFSGSCTDNVFNKLLCPSLGDITTPPI